MKARSNGRDERRDAQDGHLEARGGRGVELTQSGGGLSSASNRPGQRRWGFVGLTLAASVACGGPAEEPRVPPPAPPPGEEAADPTWNPDPVSQTVSEEAEPADEAAPPQRQEPQFTPGMSVNDAIAAVPSHYDFVGLDAEVLAKPLQDPALYEPCKVTNRSRFTVRLAVWDGRVVGADVKAEDPNLARCIDGLVRQLEYQERALSINTVEFSY